MLTQLATQGAVTALAAAPIPAPTAPSFLKTAGIWGILAFVVTVIVVWVGIKLMMKSDKQKVGKSMETAGNVGIGLLLVVIGFVGAALTIVASALGFFTTAA